MSADRHFAQSLCRHAKYIDRVGRVDVVYIFFIFKNLICIFEIYIKIIKIDFFC